MITHDTLYSLANSLGALAMITVVAYHFVAVNAKYLAKNGAGYIRTIDTFSGSYDTKFFYKDGDPVRIRGIECLQITEV
ncbi:hypothetical protein HETIRDRAFT_454609 [Heterobasidion irregulare TC 32-1]|uniref:Dolichyl-diphosphooligosaccharide--protein glycosyltransferase subunit 4 n=1 Tax=Heterobasidion irregulare (strain TC 32-1) TaxID=747525 RepID=W4JUP3_HETIT|nr:uncharacterized protein HETIRDRAFT_454609 [Heterobasidion irregulare TC 32-1]ETW77268.1 hypothetical protein HETIRDRAFT_454609 [Heterobasidion irregulare TC 32-1]